MLLPPLFLVTAVAATAAAVASRELARQRAERRARAETEAARGRLQAFLQANPGPFELRPIDGWRTPMLLAHPTFEEVIELTGDEGAELWRLGVGTGGVFVRVPAELRVLCAAAAK